MRVALFAGHSGGHLFPALSFAEAFKAEHPQSRIHLITSRKGEGIVSRMPQNIFDQTTYFPDFPYPRGFSWSSFSFCFKLLSAFGLAYRLLKEWKPDLTVGFGSYIAYPGLLTSAWIKIPTMIHEQNVIPGKATEWLASHVDCVCVSFEKTFSHKKLKRIEVVGLPLRAELRQAAQQKAHSGGDWTSRKVHLMVVGGSQGANRLNQLILESFSRFSREELKKIAVKHVTGKVDYETVSRQYEDWGIEHQTFPFYREMGKLYGEADMAVTRAGANTLFELAMFGIPSIIIPYPHADGHQSLNAETFREAGAVVVRSESELDGVKLCDEIRFMISDPQKRYGLQSAIKRFAGYGAEKRLVKIASQLISQERTCKQHVMTS